MRTASCESSWAATPYLPDAICDVCLSTKKVRVGSIPVVLRDGRPWPATVCLWSLCDSCHSLGSGIASDVSVNGVLVYLCVRVVDGNITQQFVFVPLMFREDSF